MVVIIPKVIAFAFSAWVYSIVVVDLSNGRIGSCVEGCQESVTLDNNGIKTNSPFSPKSHTRRANTQSQNSVNLLAQYPARLVVGQSGIFSAEPRVGNPPFIFEWDFGDGTKSDSKVATHAYYGEDAYYVTIKIKDGKGDTDALSPIKMIVSNPQ